MRRTLLLCIFIGLTGAAHAGGTIYTNVTLIDGTGTPARPHMAIVVKDERIAAIEPAVKPGKDVVDMHGAFALPGLINTHVHLATWPDLPFAQAQLRRDLFAGITAVRDMAGDTRELGYLARTARIGETPGSDVYYAALMAGPEFFHDPRTVDSTQGGLVPGQTPWMRAVTRETDLALAIAEAKGTGATAIKIYADLPAPLVGAIAAEAHRQHLMVWAHAAVFPASPRDVVDAKVDVVSHACMLGYQASEKMPPAYHHRAAVEADKFANPNAALDGLLADMKTRGTILDATLYVYQILDKMKDANPPPYCTLALAEKLTGEARRTGVAISARHRCRDRLEGADARACRRARASRARRRHDADGRDPLCDRYRRAHHRPGARHGHARERQARQHRVHGQEPARRHRQYQDRDADGEARNALRAARLPPDHEAGGEGRGQGVMMS